MNWLPIPIGAIRVGHRLRPVDPNTVANLSVAIEESGFTTAITIRTVPSEEGDQQYELVAGAHRLAAMRALGRTQINAVVLTLTDDQAAQIEIDENLVRRELVELEKGEMVLKRLEIYARQHPDRFVRTDDEIKAKRSRPKKSDTMSDFLVQSAPTMGFSSDAAAAIGVTDRSIRRWLAVGQGIPADIRAKLHGSPIAQNAGALRQLAAIGDKAQQAKVAEVLISGQTKSVSDALAIAAGNVPSKAVQTPVDETLKAFRGLWGKASPAARAAILNDLAGRSLPKGWIVRGDGE